MIVIKNILFFYHGKCAVIICIPNNTSNVKATIEDYFKIGTIKGITNTS